MEPENRPLKFIDADYLTDSGKYRSVCQNIRKAFCTPKHNALLRLLKNLENPNSALNASQLRNILLYATSQASVVLALKRLYLCTVLIQNQFCP
jgi:hypothetical protein